MIKVILWDIDGTLLNFKEAEKNAIRKCFESLNLGECSDLMLDDYSNINKNYWESLERGEITKEKILVKRFEDFFRKYGLPTKKAIPFNDEYQIRLGDTICFNDNAYELVKELKVKAGIKQYAVTNGTYVAQEKKLRLSGLGELFDGVFISDKMGVEKPGKGFFDIVFKEIGKYSCDETMIVGDSLTSDIAGGNNVGIICCWYNQNNITCNWDIRIDYEINNLNQIRDIIN